MTNKPVESSPSAASIPEDEIWNIEEFKKYKITLINNGRQTKIVDFDPWKSENME